MCIIYMSPSDWYIAITSYWTVFDKNREGKVSLFHVIKY